MRTCFRLLGVLGVAFTLLPATDLQAQCPGLGLQNYTGGGSVACACFVPGEEAGAIFNLPAGDFPIEILTIGIGWGSQFGGSPDTLEQAIKIYPAGLPDPGAPIFTLPGPVLTDGVINQFDIESLPGEVIVDSGPFTVTIEFLNQSASNSFQPAVVHDGNGCQAGKNIVKVESGDWSDACPLGVTGDWVFQITYRPVSCGGSGSVPDGKTVAGSQLELQVLSNGDLLLLWDDSCEADDTDYAIYEGQIGTWYSHVIERCSTSGSTSSTLSPGSGSLYYLVVPRASSTEGSYGRDAAGTERPAATTGCTTQLLGDCVP